VASFGSLRVPHTYLPNVTFFFVRRLVCSLTFLCGYALNTNSHSTGGFPDFPGKSVVALFLQLSNAQPPYVCMSVQTWR